MRPKPGWKPTGQGMRGAMKFGQYTRGITLDANGKPHPETWQRFMGRVENLERPLTGEEVDQCRTLQGFSQVFWDCVNPGSAERYVHGWHAGCLFEHYDELLRIDGCLRNLGVFFPIRVGKSIITNVMLPAYAWLRRPSLIGMFATFDHELGNRDAIYMRDIVTSPRYQYLTSLCKLRDDQNTIRRFSNMENGMRMTLTVGAGLGFGGDLLAVDDSISPKHARSATRREDAIRWYRGTFRQRVRDPNTVRRIISGQRLEQGDLPDYVMQEEFEEWDTLILPMRYEPQRIISVPNKANFDPKTLPPDPIVRTKLQDRRPELRDDAGGSGRKTPGDLLWPQRFNAERVKEMVRTLGRDAAAQLDQRPSADSGSIFRMEHIRRYRFLIRDGKLAAVALYPAPNAKPDIIEAKRIRWFQTMDTALTKKDSSSNTAIGTFGITDHNMLVIWDAFAEKLDVQELWPVVKALKKGPIDYADSKVINRGAWPFRLMVRYCERKASGFGVIAASIAEGDPIVACPVDTKDKELRASTIAMMYRNGQVYHPMPGPEWLEKLEEEMRLFPVSVKDDRIDMLSYAGIVSATDRLLRSHVNRSIIIDVGEDAPGGPVPKTEDIAEKLMPKADATLPKIHEEAVEEKRDSVELEPGMFHYPENGQQDRPVLDPTPLKMPRPL